ncbi:MAG: DUF3347 domain-containing protein, partial [Deltaproteobacteria bacterium]
FVIQGALAGDTTDGVADAAKRLGAALDALTAVPIPDQPHFWHRHAGVATVKAKAGELAAGPAIADARVSLALLSEALVPLVAATGVPPGLAAEVERVHCPMYREEHGGATWLQRRGDVRNPYYGAMMLECYDTRATLPATGGGR